MKKRKSPIRHHVRKYKRKTGTEVNDYNRGKGKRPPQIKTPSISNPKTNSSPSPNNYQARIIYVSGPAETFPVTASSYPEALETALISRFYPNSPYMIEVKRT